MRCGLDVVVLSGRYCTVPQNALDHRIINAQVHSSEQRLVDEILQEALTLAEEAAKLAPDQLYPEWALGDAAAAAGKKDEARTAYEAAIIAANKAGSGEEGPVCEGPRDQLEKALIRHPHPEASQG